MRTGHVHHRAELIEGDDLGDVGGTVDRRIWSRDPVMHHFETILCRYQFVIWLARR